MNDYNIVCWTLLDTFYEIWENSKSHNDTKQLTKYDKTLSVLNKELWEGWVVQWCQPRWCPSQVSRTVTVVWFHEMQSMTVVRQKFQTEQPTRDILYQWCKMVTEMTYIILTEQVADKELWMVTRNAFRQHLVKCLSVKKRTKTTSCNRLFNQWDCGSLKDEVNIQNAWIWDS